MAYISYTKEMNLNMEEVTVTTPASAENMNDWFAQLLGNSAFLQDKLKEIGIGGDGSSGGVSLNGGKITVTDPKTNTSVELLPSGIISFKESDELITQINIKDIKKVIDWKTTAEKNISDMKSWQDRYNTLIRKLAGEA